MEILAHRTAMANAPPNSLEGLEKCSEFDLEGIECDVVFSRDGQPFIWSDPMNYLVGLNQSISKLSHEEILKCKRSDCSEPIFYLPWVLTFLEYHPRVKTLFLDIKYLPESCWEFITHVKYNFTTVPQPFFNLVRDKILEPATSRNLERRMGLVTFRGGIDLLRMAKNEYPGVTTNLLLVFPPRGKGTVAVEDYLKWGDSITIGWEGINQWRLFPSSLETMLEAARRSGVKIYGGLAKGEADVGWLVENGFDGIWADDITMVREVLNSEI